MLGLYDKDICEVNIDNIILKENANLGRIEDITLPQLNDDNLNLSNKLNNREKENISENSELLLWPSINNEDFIYRGEDIGILENIREVEKEDHIEPNNKNNNLEERIDLACESQNKEKISKKRVRNLNYLDLDLIFVNKKKDLWFDNVLLNGMDGILRGWDTHMWWQMKNEKNEKKQFLTKFTDLATKVATKKKRVTAVDSNNLRNFGEIEKYRGSINVNEPDLGFESYYAGNSMKSPLNKNYRESLNSSEDARINSERSSLMFSNTRESGIRLSTMLETNSIKSYGSSPFQFEKIGDNRVVNNHKNFRTNSITSDIFALEETQSNNWSRSGITTSSGTYNLRTYTVQKFITTRMKEIREIRKINKDNGYILDEDENDELTVSLNELIPEKTTSRNTAATFFYHLLVLATYNEIKLEQEIPGGSIKIKKNTSFGNEES